jgi:hypothetical protein
MVSGRMLQATGKRMDWMETIRKTHRSAEYQWSAEHSSGEQPFGRAEVAIHRPAQFDRGLLI